MFFTNENAAPLRVAVYARVSTRKDAQNHSLAHQKSVYSQLLKTAPGCCLAAFYSDEGISGRREQRPGLIKMMEDARKGRFQLLLTKSVSRLARNTVTVLRIVRELKAYNIPVYFELEKINTSSMQGELMLSLMASFAEEESRSIRENVRWSIQKRFSRGIPTVLTRYFTGYYYNEEKQLVIHPSEALLVRRIFSLYLSGLGVFRIACLLNRENIPSPMNARWDPSVIRYILANERYRGDCLLQKYYTPEHLRQKALKNRRNVTAYYVHNSHEPLIHPDMWEKAQALRLHRCRQHGIDLENREKYGRRYPLSGLLLCPHCHKGLIRQALSHGEVQWVCSTHRRRASACPGIRIMEAEILDHISAITEKTIVEEVIIHGKTHYRYTAESRMSRRCSHETQNTNSRLLPGVHPARRTAIQL